MFNKTQVIEVLQNTPGNDQALAYIAREFFFWPTIAILSIMFLLMIALALFTIKRKGWDLFFIIFIIPTFIGLLLFAFTVYFPIFTDWIHSLVNSFIK